jgi:nuclear cap-binding protein subunit 1
VGLLAFIFHPEAQSRSNDDSVTEQPYKIPYYAALLRLLHDRNELSLPDEQPIGRLILDEFWRGFQSYLDKVAWRETRFCVSPYKN